jgi:thioredoxin reductase (NADPH)
MLERNPQARTVPQIFIDDKLIGGYTDLVENYSEQ